MTRQPKKATDIHPFHFWNSWRHYFNVNFLGVAREVVKHPGVKNVHQVEIDGRVVELSKKYLPNMACGFDSPKLTLTIGDGFDFMKKHVGEFDVIITDSSDPIGPAESLFQESYFALMKRALKPNGVICSQGGTFWTDMAHVKTTMDHCRKQFPTVGYAITSVPSYPCGKNFFWFRWNFFRHFFPWKSVRWQVTKDMCGT